MPRYKSLWKWYRMQCINLVLSSPETSDKPIAQVANENTSRSLNIPTYSQTDCSILEFEKGMNEELRGICGLAPSGDWNRADNSARHVLLKGSDLQRAS